MQKEKLFDLKGLSKFSTLGCSTIREYVRDERLPAYKVKGKYLFKQSEFMDWLDKFKVNTDVHLIVTKALNKLNATDT